MCSFCTDGKRNNLFILRTNTMLCISKGRMEVRRKFFVERVVRCWNRQPRKVVDILSLEVIKARLNKALDKLVQQQIWRLVGLAVAVSLELSDPWVPSNPRHFMIIRNDSSVKLSTIIQYGSSEEDILICSPAKC